MQSAEGEVRSEKREVRILFGVTKRWESSSAKCSRASGYGEVSRAQCVQPVKPRRRKEGQLGLCRYQNGAAGARDARGLWRNL